MYKFMSSRFNISSTISFVFQNSFSFFTKKLEYLDKKIVFQDESLTSVMAEQRLKSYGRPYAKGDIDAQAATIILQDYLEQNYG